jgi:putative ABC transport system permease protein
MRYTLRLLKLAWKEMIRRPARTALALSGIAASMFLFVTIRSLQEGVRAATTREAGEAMLVVYRENRYCPFTSRLPQHYESRIQRIEGVRTVMPVQIVLSNCRTSMDVVTFRGIPTRQGEKFLRETTRLRSGSIEDWLARSDTAILGPVLAARRGLKVGDRFEAAGVSVLVSGILDTDREQERNVAYVHLSYLQLASGQRNVGIVTQFNVTVTDPARLEEVAGRIDDEFASDPDPTNTTSEQAFVARAAADIIQLVSFTKWLGWGALATVLALVSNAIILSVRDRVKEHAVLQTLGFRPGLVGKLVVLEGALLGFIGGAVGVFPAVVLMAWRGLSITTEGLSVTARPTPSVLAAALALGGLLGLVASVVPAWQCMRRPIVESFRAV